MATITERVKAAVDSIDDSGNVAAKFVDPAQLTDVVGKSGNFKPLAAFEKEADNIVVKLGADTEVLKNAAEVEISRIAHFEKETFVAGTVYAGPKIYFIHDGLGYTPLDYPYTASPLIQTDIDSGVLTIQQGLSPADIGRKGADIPTSQDTLLALTDLSICIDEDLEVGQQVKAQAEGVELLVVPPSQGDVSKGRFHDMKNGNQLKVVIAGQVDTWAELLLIEPKYEGQRLELLGHTWQGLGGGVVVAKFNSNKIADGGTVGKTPLGMTWERQLAGYVTPEMFGANPDWYEEDGATVNNNPTDNLNPFLLALAANDAVRGAGDYGVSGKVTVGEGQKLYSEGSMDSFHVRALLGFTDDCVIDLAGTRAALRMMSVSVSTDIYDPATDDGTEPEKRIDCIRTTGVYYHANIADVTTYYGYKSFHLASLEGKVKRCHALKSYDAYSIANFDNHLSIVSATDIVNMGLDTNAGIEGDNIHLVRCGGRSVNLFNQAPVMLSQLFIDTPSSTGINFNQINGAILDGVYFTKIGKYADIEKDLNYFSFANSRESTINGAVIFKDDGEIDQTNKYFCSFADSGDDTKASINNTFSGFNLGDLKIASNKTKELQFTRQNVHNCSGSEISRYSTLDDMVRSPGYSIEAGATQSVKMFLKGKYGFSGFFAAFLEGRYLIRNDANHREYGVLLVSVPSEDYGTDEAYLEPFKTRAGPVFTNVIAHNVVFDAAAETISFDITNNEENFIKFSFKLGDGLRDTGAFL